MRHDYTLHLMIDSGADLKTFFAPWPQGTRDYEELGMPEQGLAIKLKSKGIIMKKGVKLHYGEAVMVTRGEKQQRVKPVTRRTLWAKGCNYDALRDYYLEKWPKKIAASASCLQCGQEMPVSAAP